MALLMLSLIKSILVVKLLHHSEKEVRQMSVSACLLDKYGSAGQGFSESALTSVNTLDFINPSGGKLRVLLTGDTQSVQPQFCASFYLKARMILKLLSYFSLWE